MLEKEDLVERLRLLGYTKKDAETVLRDMTDLLMQALAGGESVHIRGFGTFELRNTTQRECMNFKTGERIIVPDYKRVVFFPSTSMKKAIKEGFVRK